MIATIRRRIVAAAGAVARWEREGERKVAQRLGPPLRGAGRGAAGLGARWLKRVEKGSRRLGGAIVKRLRPAIVWMFRALAAAEAALRRAVAWAVRAATRASAVVTPPRAIGGVVVIAAACLVVSQFVDYRGVEIGRPGYAGLPDVASAPTVAVRTAGAAHAYLLIPLAVAAAALAMLALRPGRRRLGRVVSGLGLLSIAVILLIDLPAGLDASAQSSRFSGATAVLDDGFYAELVASAVIALGGLLLARDPSRRKASAFRGLRKPRPARTQGGGRRKRTSAREEADRPRTPPDEGLQRPATMRGRA